MRRIHIILILTLFFPSGYALVVVSLAPMLSEFISFKMQWFASAINFGRSTPWVEFTGLPYQSTLQFLGALTALAAAILALLVVALMLRAILVSSATKEERIAKYKGLMADKNTSAWLGQQVICLFLFLCCIYLTYATFVSKVPIYVNSAANLALHILLASSSPCGVIMMIVLLTFNFRLKYSHH